MPQYMLFMRGDQSRFQSLTPEEQQRVINTHREFAGKLHNKQALVEGNGFAFQTTLLTNNNNTIEQTSSPFANTENQPSGFYIIECDSTEQAIEYAKQCPALLHGESVEVIKLGH